MTRRATAANDSGIEPYLLNLARKHADDTRPRKRGGPWSWTDARARAPWSKELPAAWEERFRDAYAERLVELRLALPVGRSRTSGAAPTEGVRAERGQGRLNVRMSADALAKLGRLAESAGTTQSGWIERAVIAAVER